MKAQSSKFKAQNKFQSQSFLSRLRTLRLGAIAGIMKFEI
jgi:hypothetical protein